MTVVEWSAGLGVVSVKHCYNRRWPEADCPLSEANGGIADIAVGGVVAAKGLANELRPGWHDSYRDAWNPLEPVRS